MAVPFALFFFAGIFSCTVPLGLPLVRLQFIPWAMASLYCMCVCIWMNVCNVAPTRPRQLCNGLNDKSLLYGRFYLCGRGCEHAKDMRRRHPLAITQSALAPRRVEQHLDYKWTKLFEKWNEAHICSSSRCQKRLDINMISHTMILTGHIVTYILLTFTSKWMHKKKN